MSDELRPPPVIDEGEPEAVVERVGRWLYSISIEHGIMHHHVRHVLGWERAMRKARQELQRYQETRAREKRRWVVRNDFPRADVSGSPPFSQVQPRTPPKGPSGVSASEDGSR